MYTCMADLRLGQIGTGLVVFDIDVNAKQIGSSKYLTIEVSDMLVIVLNI